MPASECLLQTLAQLRATAAPARMLLYYRSSAGDALSHGSVTLHHGDTFSIDLAGKALPEALRELAGAKIERTVLRKNAWISAVPDPTELIEWDALVVSLSRVESDADTHRLPIVSGDSADADPAWLGPAAQRVLKLFEGYYGLAAAGQVDALVRLYARAVDAQQLLDAAERTLARVVGAERARSDLNAVRQQLQARN
jgi:hypothetical protein